MILDYGFGTMTATTIFSKKEFAIVSNMRLISRTKFVLSLVEHEKKKQKKKHFINSGPGKATLTENNPFKAPNKANKSQKY